MNRIAQIFAEARAQRRGLVLPFLTAGQPSVDLLDPLLDALERSGASAAEIGIPFSDPIADGPVIAASMHDALQRGVTPSLVFERLKIRAEQRARTPSRGPGLPTVAMVSTSIVFRFGIERFAERVSGSGLDGMIVPDADIDTAEEIVRACDRHRLACAFLIAPTSSADRVKRIVGLCRGFVYLLARAGVTGEQRAPAAAAASSPGVAASGAPASGYVMKRQAELIRTADPSLPIAAGFGIATADDVRAVLQHVDGAIVGSAIVRRINDAISAGQDPVAAVEKLVTSLVAAANADAAR